MLLEWGKIVNTHGVRGELKVEPYIDIPGIIKHVKALDVDGVSYRVLACRAHKGMALLTLEGIGDMESAEGLKNKLITTPRAAVDLGEGHYFYSDLPGFDVFDITSDSIIGQLVEVENYPMGDMYLVSTPKGEVRIPVNPAFAKDVQPDKRLITVKTIEGMLDNEN